MTANSTLYVPLQPAQVANPNGALFDLEMQFLNMVRKPPTVDQWHTRFAYMPPGAFEQLEVRFPIDLTSFAFQAHQGFDFEEGSSTYIDLNISPFSAGTHLDVRKLRSNVATEIIGWNQRAEGLMGAWQRFLPPKIYTMLSNGETAISGGHKVTGGSAFFATNHFYNRDKTGYGTFSNLIDNGGALASSPIYFMLSGGSFSAMKPWAIIKGAGLGNALSAAGANSNAPSNGDPWIIKWGFESDSQLADLKFRLKLAVYQEIGYGFLFPHTCVRYEGTLDYAGLKSVVDAVRGFKDLNGYNDAASMKIDAILCEPSQVSTINGLLGREVTDTGARSVDLRIDSTLQGAAVIPMSR